MEADMGTFNVELKKIVDDSYDIEIGFHLEDKLISDLKAGLVGKINKFASSASAAAIAPLETLLLNESIIFATKIPIL
jgi:hypothetical protein